MHLHLSGRLENHSQCTWLGWNPDLPVFGSLVLESSVLDHATTKAGPLVAVPRLIKPYACNQCHKMFKHPASLRQHFKAHTGETKCPLCHAVMNRKYELREHMRRRHNVVHFARQQASGTEGNGTVDSSLCLGLAMWIAGNAERSDLFPCEVCGKSFKHRASRYNHMARHLGTTQCHICQTVLGQKNSYRRHMKHVHGMD
uniref:C2H2-type domain-containing protein n=1 Tax=Timema tahoe TaxID=61484 RepID=A0A7R9IE30_9NEOP|nr:unnamed protein product [Timema tahoe]